MNKKYAIFDMDGTLVDSMGYWKRLAGEYLETHGGPESTKGYSGEDQAHDYDGISSFVYP